MDGPERSPEYLRALLSELRGAPAESEWLEFKVNNSDPDEIGEYVSALANSAALAGRSSAYLVWGIRDSDHAVVGTTFDPTGKKVGNENLENWLGRLTTPETPLLFNKFEVDGQTIVLLEIASARSSPIQFKGVEYIRVGSYKKKLKDHPSHARRLWRAFDRFTFEEAIAYPRARDDQVLALLDYPEYFELLGRPLPENRSGILSALEADSLISRAETGDWNITNLGAILFGRRLDAFLGLKRKALRVIQYRGISRVETIREQEGVRGYAAGFAGMIDYILNLLPSNEVIGKALRETVPMYPELAIRELVANALIHQDFSETGSGPMVELFDDRLEITSPGLPLVEPARFVDAPPRSRNESLASMMRRIGICEERGTGWDKVGFEIELHQLPAPLVEVPEGHTRVILFSPRQLQKMEKSDRVRAVYLHACLRHVTRQHMTNSSVRERFGIEAHNAASASRLINEAVDAGLVAPYDAGAPKKLMRYVPYWAAGDDGSHLMGV